MSLLEILDSMKNFNGGHTNHSTDKIQGGTLVGDILAGSIIKYGFIGTSGLFSFLIISSLILLIWTIVRVVNCSGFSDLIKILLVLTILFVPIPFKTLIIFISTYFLEGCKKKNETL